MPRVGSLRAMLGLLVLALALAQQAAAADDDYTFLKHMACPVRHMLHQPDKPGFANTGKDCVEYCRQPGNAGAGAAAYFSAGTTLHPPPACSCIWRRPNSNKFPASVCLAADANVNPRLCSCRVPACVSSRMPQNDPEKIGSTGGERVLEPIFSLSEALSS